MDKRLDIILAGLKSPSTEHNRLNSLESVVWANITAQKIEQPVGGLERLISLLFPAQHRFAPIMCAALLGLMVGFATLPTSKNLDAAEMLNFKVFKPQAFALASLTQN